jgi:hypothetical protein
MSRKRPKDNRPPRDQGQALRCPHPGCTFKAYGPRAVKKLDDHYAAEHGGGSSDRWW